MNSLNNALLINLLGFSLGIALYALLLVMVLRHRRSARPGNIDYLLIATACLGLSWNLGELLTFAEKDFGIIVISPFLTASAYAALGFLPSVVVHSAQAEEEKPHWLTFTAYGLSALAAVLHFYSAMFSGAAPSDLALQMLTYGSIALAAALLIFNFRQTLEKKAIWVTALLVFAVSALHLTGQREENSWLVELVAHQSSLPLALAILYQNYRFAFADLFLKRAISLILLTLVAFGLYVYVAAPLLHYHETHDRDDVQAITLILTLWIATALIYPWLHTLAVWLVDKAILHRVDYDKLRRELSSAIEKNESADEILDAISLSLSQALTARSVEWKEIAGEEDALNSPSHDAQINIPTAELPQYQIVFSDFIGGRRLMSDETAMLADVSVVTARRIDALRVTHERCQQEFREEEFAKLAAEAQLTALRSQINPHFLFNALTTIGYLIQSSPDKAFQTLLHLTKLLRGVLSSTDEFSTLGQELKLIENYLDIERARFEEKLSVSIDVPADLENIRVPSLILQPLVENAIKHGVSENKSGGEVRISAELGNAQGEMLLKLSVFDTGAGKKAVARKDGAGVGLKNVRERLRSYYGRKAELTLDRNTESGTTAEISLPLKSQPI
ncbi:MAG TPA: histidine kinase [Pyrinomonadaceae bacterium]|nr:histidine kinase [Pyrinomonadaceae bacterium]